MGHFNDIVKATGKTVNEAKNNACDEFLHEHGHRYDIRDVKMVRFVRDVPPKKKIVKMWKGETYTQMSDEDDLSAPASEWTKEWEFDIHSHA